MSGLTFKETIRATLADLMAEDQRVFVIGEDVGVLGGAFGVTAGLLDRFGPLLHQAALAHYASGGANTVPLVIRANYGMGPGAGPQDSGTLYGALLQFPGLTVVIPTSPAEAAALLRQAVRDPNPVLFLEPRELYGATDQIADLSPLPMTKARVLRTGADLTCVAAGGMVRKALAAADRLAAEDIAVEVIDLRCIMPLDQTTVVASVARTGRILALDEGPRGGGLAAEVLALVAESDVISGRRGMHRLTAAPAPIAYAPHLAAAAVPDGNAVESAMRDMLTRDALTRHTVIERQS